MVYTLFDSSICHGTFDIVSIEGELVREVAVSLSETTPWSLMRFVV